MTAATQTSQALNVASTEARSSEEIANLDFLRAVAVSLVFFGHLLPHLGIRVGVAGRFGVLLFFVHTSLVLVMSMGRMNRRGGELYRSFMTRRIFRLYPLSIICVLLVTALQIPADDGYAWHGWGTMASNLLLVQNLSQTVSTPGVLWSLPFEIQMYALLPLLFLWLVNRWTWRRGAALWAMAVLIASAEYLLRPQGFDTRFLIARYFPCFVSGVIAWRVMRNSLARYPGWAWVAALVTVVVLDRIVDGVRVYGIHTFSTYVANGLRHDHRIWWPAFLDLPRDWLFCAGVGALIPMFREIRATWLKRSSHLIAKYSYGIYLFHVPIFYLFLTKWATGFRALDLGIAGVVLIVVVATAFHLIENPFIQAGKRLASRPAARVAFRTGEARVG